MKPTLNDINAVFLAYFLGKPLAPLPRGFAKVKLARGSDAEKANCLIKLLKQFFMLTSDRTVLELTQVIAEIENAYSRAEENVKSYSEFILQERKMAVFEKAFAQSRHWKEAILGCASYTTLYRTTGEVLSQTPQSTEHALVYDQHPFHYLNCQQEAEQDCAAVFATTWMTNSAVMNSNVSAGINASSSASSTSTSTAIAIASSSSSSSSSSSASTAMPSKMAKTPVKTPLCLDLGISVYTRDARNNITGFIIAHGDGLGGHHDAHEDRKIASTVQFATKNAIRLLAAYADPDSLSKETLSTLVPALAREVKLKCANEPGGTTIAAARAYAVAQSLRIVGFTIGDTILVAWVPSEKRFLTLAPARVSIMFTGEGPASFPADAQAHEVLPIDITLPLDTIIFAMTDGVFDWLPTIKSRAVIGLHEIQDEIIDPAFMQTLLATMPSDASAHQYVELITRVATAVQEHQRAQRMAAWRDYQGSNAQKAHEAAKAQLNAQYDVLTAQKAALTPIAPASTAPITTPAVTPLAILSQFVARIPKPFAKSTTAVALIPQVVSVEEQQRQTQLAQLTAQQKDIGKRIDLINFGQRQVTQIKIGDDYSLAAVRMPSHFTYSYHAPLALVEKKKYPTLSKLDVTIINNALLSYNNLLTVRNSNLAKHKESIAERRLVIEGDLQDRLVALECLIQILAKVLAKLQKNINVGDAAYWHDYAYWNHLHVKLTHLRAKVIASIQLHQRFTLKDVMISRIRKDEAVRLMWLAKNRARPGLFTTMMSAAHGVPILLGQTKNGQQRVLQNPRVYRAQDWGQGLFLDEKYLIEQTDPQHRAWRNIYSSVAAEIYATWQTAQEQGQTALSLTEWAALHAKGAKVERIQFFNEEQRYRYLANTSDRKKLVYHDVAHPSQGKMLVDGNYLFTMDLTGNLFIAPEGPENSRKPHIRVQHPSFTQGGPVACAGKVSIISGKIKAINNESGHYRPDGYSMSALLQELQKRGVLADRLQITMIGDDDRYPQQPMCLQEFNDILQALPKTPAMQHRLAENPNPLGDHDPARKKLQTVIALRCALVEASIVKDMLLCEALDNVSGDHGIVAILQKLSHFETEITNDSAEMSTHYESINQYRRMFQREIVAKVGQAGQVLVTALQNNLRPYLNSLSPDEINARTDKNSKMIAEYNMSLKNLVMALPAASSHVTSAMKH